MPYRSAPVDREKRVAEAGIVSDMVRQFADKHAFLRELVQNGIDAGARRIDVQIDRDDSGVVRTSVTDDGIGMTREIIEGPLLTLFSSSKEGDASKIGKYGIGFVSVFALEPDCVDVRTHRNEDAKGPNPGWLVRLFGDHTWELSPSPPDPTRPHGTTVSLVQPMSVEEFTAHVAASKAALTRWCRHAQLPIDLVVLDAGDPAAASTTALQEPFTAPGLVSVIWTGTGDEEGERIVASAGGADANGGSFLGYYNRGLTLFETTATERALAGVRVKIDSPRLSHTLSRDGVVRDAELRRLHRRAVSVVESSLCDEVHRQVARAAETAILPADYLALVAAAEAKAFAAARSEERLVVPLVEPIEGKTAITMKELLAASHGEILVAPAPTPLTRALARDGRPVVRWLESISYLRGFSNGVELADVGQAIAYAGPVTERHEGDDALEAAVLALLRKLGRSSERVQIARFEGASKTDAFRVTNERESALPVAVTARAWGREWGQSATVQLNVEDAAVRLARRRSRTEPVVAAHLLCRALFLADGPLPAKMVDRMLEAALE